MTSNSWANGLVQTLKNPKSHIISSNLAVVISDKYPKAKHHYLVLPLEEIHSIFNAAANKFNIFFSPQLNRQHIPLLQEMHLLALNIIEIKGEKQNNFKIGFHNQPSMHRLHLHVISKDFISDCLKTKKHWNSFNTQLFLNYEDMLVQLEETNQVKRLESALIKELGNMDLKCNQCAFVAKNMPSLKQHLLEH
ncbi:aprataxin-like protein isoform X1 [Stomoxys calcitrans]|uniref:aprataxin-like protein isoform X1 n=1 Tax=Stomoxys calcitrans TaxID=35570 RepID=UPI0027E29E4E|nr:aprataxin-like protein isoform X1 [Stomoxys calcitrans]